MSKKLLTTALLSCFVFCAGAQVNYEATYNYPIGSYIDFGVCQLDSTTYKYYCIEYDSSRFTLYNLNHSILMVVNFPVVYNNYNIKIQYITKSLFDCDSTNIEYLLNYRDLSLGITYVKIFRVNGPAIFTADSMQAVYCVGCQDLYGNYIYETSAGTKMILKQGIPTNATTKKIYSVCGSIPTGGFINSENKNLLSNPYPNPTNDFARIPYTLPEGENTGELVFYDVTGKEIKRFKVDKTFQQIIISSADLAPGTYYYHLQTPKNTSEGKTLVVIK